MPSYLLNFPSLDLMSSIYKKNTGLSFSEGESVGHFDMLL